MRTQFDDGSWLDYDDNWNVIAGADSAGVALPAPSTRVVDEVLGLLSYGMRSLIDTNKLKAQAQTQATYGAPVAAQQASSMLVLGALALGAFFILKG